MKITIKEQTANREKIEVGTVFSYKDEDGNTHYGIKVEPNEYLRTTSNFFEGFLRLTDHTIVIVHPIFWNACTKVESELIIKE